MSAGRVAEIQARMGEIVRQMHALGDEGDALMAELATLGVDPASKPANRRSARAIKAELRKRHRPGLFRTF